MVQAGLIGYEFIAVWSANNIKIAKLNDDLIEDFEDEVIPFNDDTEILSVVSTCQQHTVQIVANEC